MSAIRNLVILVNELAPEKFCLLKWIGWTCHSEHPFLKYLPLFMSVYAPIKFVEEITMFPCLTWQIFVQNILLELYRQLQASQV